MNRCTLASEYEDLVLGNLPPARASQLIVHAAACSSCAAQWDELRQQRELFVRRARAADPMPPDLSDLFARIENRRRQARQGWRQASASLAAVVAAAAVFLVAWRGWSAVGLLAPSDAFFETAAQAESVDKVMPGQCAAMTCSQDSMVLCESVTCATPPAFVAQSTPAACDELPWMSFDRFLSEVSTDTATP